MDRAMASQSGKDRNRHSGAASIAATILAAFLMLQSGHARAEPVKLWELGGVKTPESAIVDPGTNTIYVSNVAGQPTAKDGNGTISQVSLDGHMIKADWITGLDAPKGLALIGGRLYVADIDQLVEIDVASGAIVRKHAAKDAKFLNDVAAGPDNQIYVSDTATNTIWHLAGGTFEPWLQSDGLKSPNGLVVKGDKLVVAAWGQIDGEGFATSVPGNLLEVSLADKSIRVIGDGKPVGNLDGLIALDDGTFLVTDWVAGGLLRIDANGKATKILTLPSGSADCSYVAASRTVLIPLMKDDKLLAYRLDE